MEAIVTTSTLQLPEWATRRGASPEQLLKIAESMSDDVLKKYNPALNGYLAIIATIKCEKKRKEFEILINNEKIKAVLNEREARKKILDWIKKKVHAFFFSYLKISINYSSRPFSTWTSPFSSITTTSRRLMEWAKNKLAIWFSVLSWSKRRSGRAPNLGS